MNDLLKTTGLANVLKAPAETTNSKIQLTYESPVDLYTIEGSSMSFEQWVTKHKLWDCMTFNECCNVVHDIIGNSKQTYTSNNSVEKPEPFTQENVKRLIHLIEENCKDYLNENIFDMNGIYDRYSVGTITGRVSTKDPKQSNFPSRGNY